MGNHPADVAFGRAAHKKGWVDRPSARDSMRCVRVLAENGETTTLSRVMFEQEHLSARQVYQLQQKLQQREAVCECGSRVETWGKKPGSKARCPECKARVVVPGDDPKDPFKLPKVQYSAPAHTGAEIGLGVVAILGLGAVLGQAAWETHSAGSHMGFGAVVTSGVAGALALVFALRGAVLGGAGVLLAALTGLTVAAALGNPTTAPAFSAFGVSAHQALPGLIALHLVATCWVLRRSLFANGPDGVMAWITLVSLYPLGFFVYRCLPSSDPTHYLTGPVVFGKVPWFAQPGAVAMLYLFPLAALLLGGSGVVRTLRKKGGGIATHAGFAASLFILGGFGFAVGTVGEQLPSTNNQQLEQLLAERVGPHWRAPVEEEAREHATAAVAIEAAAESPEAPAGDVAQR